MSNWRVYLWIQYWEVFKKYDCLDENIYTQEILNTRISESKTNLEKSIYKNYIPKIDSTVQNAEKENLEKALDLINNIIIKLEVIKI